MRNAKCLSRLVIKTQRGMAKALVLLVLLFGVGFLRQWGML